MTIAVLVALILLFMGTLPIHPYSRKWGYYPSGIIGFIVAVILLTIIL